VLLPGEGNTVYATYNLYWNTFNSTNGIYDATLRIRVDWNSTGVSGVISLYPNNLYLHEQIFQIYNFRNIVIERDNYGYLYFTAETEFQVHYGNIYAYFTLWVEQDNIGQRVRLTLTNYQCTSNSSGSLTLSYDDQIITT
jgi:hypothetical protein